VKTILYGHAWLSGALTAFAFFGLWRATGGFNAANTTQQAWAWAAIFAIGLLWTVLGLSYVARRDSEGGDGLEGPAPAPGAGRPAEEVVGPSRRRGAPAKYAAPLLVLLTFLAVTLLLAVAAGWWPSPTTTRPPRPFVSPTSLGRP
jgi:hypothetical protein